MENLPVDGNASLADQQNTLRFIELAGPFRLLTYKKKTTTSGATQKINMGIFEDAPLGSEIPKLILVKIPSSGNAVSVIAEHLADGKQVVFHEHVFVDGKDAEIIGFR